MGTSATPETGKKPDDAAAASGTGTGGTGAGAGTGQGGGTPPAGTGSGAPPAGTGLNREKLNPLIRGMNEEQVNEVFDGLIAAARAGATVDDKPAAVAPVPPVQFDYKEALDSNSDKFNPEGAFKHFVTANYGGLLTDIAKRTVSPMLDAAARKVSDFEKYRGDVEELLKNRDPMSVTPQEVASAYYMAKGLRASEAERGAAAKAASTTAPSPATEAVVQPKISDEEREVARRMFSRSADPIKEYLDYAKRIEDGEGSFSVKVPVGGGKKE